MHHRSGHQRPPPRAVEEEESGDRRTGEVEVGGIRTATLEGTLCRMCLACACVRVAVAPEFQSTVVPATV